MRYLEEELKRKRRNGFAIKLGGIAAGLCAMVIPAQVGAQNINKDSVKNPIPQVNALDSIAVEDLSEGAEDAIVVRARLIFDDKETCTRGFSISSGHNQRDNKRHRWLFCSESASRNKFENIVYWV